MRLRTQLTMAFSLLAIVPLGALTLYSYSSSIHAYRRAVEEETSLRAGEMQQRMGSVRADLDRRLGRAETLPLLRWGGFGVSVDSAAAERAYASLVEELGDVAPFLERLAIRPVRPPTPIDPEKAPRAPEVDSLLIFIPGMPGLANLERWLPRVKGSGPDSAASHTVDRFVRIGAAIIPRMALEFGPMGTLPIDEFETIGEAMAEAGAKGDVARILELSAKMGQEAMRWPQVSRESLTKPMPQLPPAAPKAAQPPQPGLTVVVGRDYEVTDEGRRVGTLRAELNVPAVMGRVLALSRRKEGETPFAIDTQGHLYALSDSERAALEPLSLPAGRYSGIAEADQKWVVASTEDSATGLTFGIARPIGAGLAEIRRTAARNLALGVGMIAVAMCGIVHLSKRMTANLSVLTQGAQRLATGDLDHRVPITSKDEFGVLAQTFNLMATQLSENQQRVVEQERLERELELCRQIQTEMLPKEPLRLPFAEIRGVSIPARQVGGDFFNFFPLPDGRIAVLVGDVSGKGIAAALLMANVQATLSARLPLTESLADLAAHLDEEISRSTPEGTFLTLFVGLIDHNDMTFRWLNAGHDAPYIIRVEGELVPLAATGRPLGILPGGQFHERMTDIHAGDSLFLYTDGLVEACAAEDEEFGTERLEEILKRAYHLPLDQILAEVDAAVLAYRGAAEAHDDTTMVAVKMV